MIECPVCKKMFKPIGTKQTVCSKSCARSFFPSKKKYIRKPCPICGKTVTDRRTYCSKSCANRGWVGPGRKPNIGKYIRIYKPDYPGSDKTGYIPEQRYVMEQHLGRLLTKKEVVHHLNGDRHDNRIENLHLCQSTSDHHKIFHHNRPEETKKKLSAARLSYFNRYDPPRDYEGKFISN
jgi:predicted nucleic acid-binding Zn ribbon protein